MPGSTPREQQALDTNVVLDLAADADFAHEFRESFQRASYALRLPPTVAGERQALAARGMVTTFALARA